MEIFGKVDIFCKWVWQIKDDTSSKWVFCNIHGKYKIFKIARKGAAKIFKRSVIALYVLFYSYVQN